MLDELVNFDALPLNTKGIVSKFHYYSNSSHSIHDHPANQLTEIALFLCSTRLAPILSRKRIKSLIRYFSEKKLLSISCKSVHLNNLTIHTNIPQLVLGLFEWDLEQV